MKVWARDMGSCLWISLCLLDSVLESLVSRARFLGFLCITQPWSWPVHQPCFVDFCHAFCWRVSYW